MSKNSRTFIVLVLFIVLPFLFYVLLQIKSLTDDEQTANEISSKQMENTLFSTNQLAENMADRWISQLTNVDNSIIDNARNLVLENESIQMLVLRKESGGIDSIFVNDYVQVEPETLKNIHRWYADKDSLIDQLTKYLVAGFQKIQAAEDWTPITGLDSLQSSMTVMLYDRTEELYNALIVIQPLYWVEQVLGPNLQELGLENMRLSIVQSTQADATPQVIYSTEPFDFQKDYVENSLWILPNMTLNIQSNGKSYSELIRNRSKTNLYILLSAFFIMIIGTIILIRNIQNTVKVAQLKSDFVRNVSHEIRTPLSLIKLYSETLMLGRLSSEEKKQDYYKVIHSESGRLTYLVNSILDFSKIEANRKTYEPERTALNQLVKQVYANYNHTFKEKNVEHELELSSENLDVVIDPQAFSEALSNLIENAIKYGGEHKYLMLKVRHDKRFALLDVIDHGIGIPLYEQDHIFNNFYRIEAALTQNTRGTGLGLSLVKHIMEAHNGEVQVKSIVGKGSTFTLKLPLMQI
ncbi:MAG: HAMP domain-containing histidine kinase [Saprospiraceae bacterium]|nr:HAMP domain-containing histidine kinase [Saprospiraceae bacterium]